MFVGSGTDIVQLRLQFVSLVIGKVILACHESAVSYLLLSLGFLAPVRLQGAVLVFGQPGLPEKKSPFLFVQQLKIDITNLSAICLVTVRSNMTWPVI